MQRSALIERLSAYLELTPLEREAIARIEQNEVRVRAGHALMVEGSGNDQLYVVQHGWIHASRLLANGGRQILRFHYPGDLMGTASIAWVNASTTLTAISDCIVFALNKAELGLLFAHNPRLAGLFYAMAAAENVAMSDRLTSVARMTAIERLATLLLDMLARLRVTLGGVVNSFELPLTQTDLGDAVGLTKVHVSRTLGEMERRGMIERHDRRVRILDEQALIRFTGFIDRYAQIETSWLPNVDRAAA